MAAHTESHTVTFQRDMIRALQPKSYDLKMSSLIDSIATKSLTGRGWSFDDMGYSEDTEQTEVGHRYYARIQIAFQHPTNVPGSSEFASILYTIYGRAMTNAFGNWTLTEVDGNEYAAPEDDDSVTSKIDKEMIGYADCEIPDDWTSHFEHLYGLDPHIARVRSAVDAAVRSNFRNRFNAVLVGPPGCGKSDIAESMKRALGEDAVMSFDATATTAAGMIKELNDRDILPRIVIFEEIEKASESAMQPLLGILDQRGEIRKTTARGSIQRDTKCLAIATVNDYALFQRLQAGALKSRFSNTIFFNRPTRETLSRILHREVSKVDGNAEWVRPALDYCEDHDIDDPREVIAFCLCGADDLLTGDYQKMMDATAAPQE
jgi:hypothetical protein